MNASELKKYALARALNLGQAEKDYFQNLVLFLLYRKFSKNIVFKGGTAIAKCYGLNRFSEDLDFTVVAEKNFVESVADGLSDFKIRHSVKENIFQNSRKFKLKLEGTLYSGSEKTLCSLTLDFSFREQVLTQPNLVTIGYHMDVIPVFEVYVMSEQEILAEKIRALYTRSSARDLYDLVFLLRKGVEIDENLVEKKLEACEEKFVSKTLVAKCKALKTIWQSELQSLVKNVPVHKEYVAEVEKKLVAY